MTEPADPMAGLRALCPAADLWHEGEQPLVFMPGISVESGGTKHQVDLLLCPRARDSYETRLFFSRQLPVNRNWSSFNIMTRTWHAFSWSGIPANDDWLEILATHLEAVK